MQIDESDEQSRNAPDSIRESLEPVSNVTIESLEHPVKHAAHTITTDDGMQIEEIHEQKPNAYCSRRESLEPGSNVTPENAPQRLKQ
jgi:FtsZ-binding cell division protein ZapB